MLPSAEDAIVSATSAGAQAVASACLRSKFGRLRIFLLDRSPHSSSSQMGKTNMWRDVRHKNRRLLSGIAEESVEVRRPLVGWDVCRTGSHFRAGHQHQQLRENHGLLERIPSAVERQMLGLLHPG